MPFPTLFGLSSLLKEYGVETHGYRVSDKTQIAEIPTPFIAPIDARFVIVTDVRAGQLRYSTAGVEEEIPSGDFVESWSGVAFVAKPTAESVEPDYRKHRLAEVMKSLRNVGIWVVGALLFAWFFITRGDLDNWGTIALLPLYGFGLWLSILLISKDLGVKSKHSDAVCNILAPGGCDRITKSDASTFLGIFHWSEVGFTYFAVGLSTLLLFPKMTGWLAAINICALPYTVWSITYQKFVAKTWCTMCVGVQLTLWLQFAVFLLSGWAKHIFPLEWQTAALVMVYVFAMLLLNRVKGFVRSRIPEES